MLVIPWPISRSILDVYGEAWLGFSLTKSVINRFDSMKREACSFVCIEKQRAPLRQDLLSFFTRRTKSPLSRRRKAPIRHTEYSNVYASRPIHANILVRIIHACYTVYIRQTCRSAVHGVTGVTFSIIFIHHFLVIVLKSWKVMIVFSERQLAFMFAICHRPSVYLSVCLSSVCNDRASYSGD